LERRDGLTFTVRGESARSGFLAMRGIYTPAVLPCQQLFFFLLVFLPGAEYLVGRRLNMRAIVREVSSWWTYTQEVRRMARQEQEPELLSKTEQVVIAVLVALPVTIAFILVVMLLRRAL
jgi:uncharacterized membrane protein